MKGNKQKTKKLNKHQKRKQWLRLARATQKSSSWKRKLKSLVVVKNKEYWAAQYLTPEWRTRRNQIVARDNHICTSCGCTSNLQVHHLIYDFNLNVWEYEDKHLTTLCDMCHEQAHKSRPIKEFYSKEPLVKFNLPILPPSPMLVKELEATDTQGITLFGLKTN